MTRPAILITSIGSRAAEGVLACLAPARERVRVIATNSMPDAPGLYDADAAYLVPPTAQHAAFSERLAAIVRHEQPALVINGRDEEVPALAALADRQPAAATTFLVPPTAMAPLFNDKYLTAGFASAHGLPFAPTAWTTEEVRALVARHGFPLVAKPRTGGHASRDVFVLTTTNQVDAVLQRGGFVVQAFVGGERLARRFMDWDLSLGVPWVSNPRNTYHMIDLVIGRQGEAVSLCLSEADRAGSIVQRLRWVDDARLQGVAQRHAAVLAAAGHRGPVNIQGVLAEDGEFMAFEWNARFVGSAPGYALMGQNQVLAALRHFVPALQDLVLPPQQAVTAFRPLVFRGVPAAAIDALREQGVWHRGPVDA